MEVILREDIEKLGSRGDVVKVTNGYARNFLLPKRLAVAATDSNKKIVEQERQTPVRPHSRTAHGIHDDGTRLPPAGILQPIVVVEQVRDTVVEDAELAQEFLAHRKDNMDTGLSISM